MTDNTEETVPADLAVQAYLRLDAMLPIVRNAAEALNDKDEGKSLWAAYYLLEDVSESLGGATGWC